jgi:hypothetical protein
MAKVSGRQAAIDYLRENGGGPLPVKDVTAEAAKRAGLKGKTPQATVAAMIYTGAKKGVGFKIAERGMVELLPDVGNETKGEASEPKAEVASGEESIEADLRRGTEAVTGKRQATPHPKPTSKKKSHKPVAA